MDPVAETSAPALSGAQLGEILRLLPGSDSVELKVTVPEAGRRHVMERLGMDPMQAELRQVAYFDTPDLALNRAGLVVRARRVQRKPGDSVVKLRPVVPDELSSDLRRRSGFGVEVDAMPGGFVCSARMKATPADDGLVRDVFPSVASRCARCSPSAQRALLRRPRSRRRRPGRPDRARTTVNIIKLKFDPEGFARSLVAELWFYPDGSQILELSTKVRPPTPSPSRPRARRS